MKQVNIRIEKAAGVCKQMSESIQKMSKKYNKQLKLVAEIRVLNICMMRTLLYGLQTQELLHKQEVGKELHK